MTERLSQYGAALLVPLHEEYQHLADLAPAVRTVEVEGDYYYELHPRTGGRPIIVQVLEEMGPLRAAIAAERLLTRFLVPILGLVGIAGALSDDLLLGDVVIASEIEYYQYAAKITGAPHDGIRVERGGTSWRAAPPTIGRARAFSKSPETQEHFLSWKRRVGEVNPNPANELTRPVPEVFSGPVASGDVVVAAKPAGNWLKEGNRKLLAVEMEAAGVAGVAEARAREAEWIIVRGISDFADDRKKLLDAQIGSSNLGRGVWRRYAVQSAAIFFLEFLESGYEVSQAAGTQPLPPLVPIDRYELEAALATRYSSLSSVERVLTHAGVDFSLVRMGGTARETWFEALSAAERQGMLGGVLDVVRRDYPGFLE